MANPRKFSEKIALLNQKQAEETAAFEAIMREVSDVTSRVASAGSSVGASPTGTGGVPEAPLSVKSAGASPPQSSGSKHLHINLGNQFRGGGSLPNVNNTITNRDTTNDTTTNSAAIHSIDLKTALSNLEEMQQNQMVYRNNERSRSPGVGPMRSRPMEKRYDTSPYSGSSYLSPPLPDTWRRTNSDSALHQSAIEACQSTSQIPHRRDAHTIGHISSDNRDGHHGFIERPRSSCEMPRVPGIHIYPSSQPPGPQTPIGNNTGSLPDLSNVHFPSPLHTPLDQEELSSSTQYSNNHLSVPVNSRFLRTHKGIKLENSTSTSQQDLQNYGQTSAQPPSSHSPVQYIYQQPHSPVPPQSPSPQPQQQQQQQQQQLNSLGSYRSSQQINRPSPQSSPGLTVQGSPLSYSSNNPSAPPSPTRGYPEQQILDTENSDQTNFFIQTALEQFNMMDLTTVDPNTISSYIESANGTSNFSQNDMINVGGELGSSDAGYFSTSPQIAYQPRTPTTAQQLTPQTPTIILTDFSGTDDLTNQEFVKDLGSTLPGDFDPDLFASDDVLRQGLGPIDLDGLQMLTDPDMVISDANAEDHFRLDRL